MVTYLDLSSAAAAFPLLQGLLMSLCRPLSSCLIGLSGGSSSAAVLARCFASSTGGRPAQLSQLKSTPFISTAGACTACDRSHALQKHLSSHGDQRYSFGSRVL